MEPERRRNRPIVSTEETPPRFEEPLAASHATLATLVLGVSFFATGCTADPVGRDPGLMPAEPPMATVYEYTQANDGYHLRPAEVQVPERFEGQTAFTSDAMRGVAALLDHEPASEDWHNLWKGDCAPGEEVTDVEIAREHVTVWLDGWSGTICDIEPEALYARDQQLAWTIIRNSKSELPRSPLPEIVVHDGSGLTMDPIEPDASFLPPEGEY